MNVTPFVSRSQTTALCLEVADHGLEIGHLEVGKRVISDRWGALEDQDLAAISAAQPDRDGALEVFRLLKTGYGHRCRNHDRADYLLPS